MNLLTPPRGPACWCALLGSPVHTANKFPWKNQPSHRLDAGEPTGQGSTCRLLTHLSQAGGEGQAGGTLRRIVGCHSTRRPNSQSSELPNLAIIVDRSKGQLKYE